MERAHLFSSHATDRHGLATARSDGWRRQPLGGNSALTESTRAVWGISTGRISGLGCGISLRARDLGFGVVW